MIRTFTYQRRFHGVTYDVKLELESREKDNSNSNSDNTNSNTVDSLTLQVDCDDAQGSGELLRWRASFTSLFIEEITRRTGNFKAFAVFVKMLQSGLEQDDSTT